MTQKKMRELLREKNISNSHHFAGSGNVFIAKYNEEMGRAYRNARFVVVRPGYETNPNGPWYDNGNKTFNIYHRERRAEILKEAQRWASAQYGIREWAKTPFGDWMDKEFVEKRLRELGIKP